MKPPRKQIDGSRSEVAAYLVDRTAAVLASKSLVYHWSSTSPLLHPVMHVSRPESEKPQIEWFRVSSLEIDSTGVPT